MLFMLTIPLFLARLEEMDATCGYASMTTRYLLFVYFQVQRRSLFWVLLFMVSVTISFLLQVNFMSIKSLNIYVPVPKGSLIC